METGLDSGRLGSSQSKREALGTLPQKTTPALAAVGGKQVSRKTARFGLPRTLLGSAQGWALRTRGCGQGRIGLDRCRREAKPGASQVGLADCLPRCRDPAERQQGPSADPLVLGVRRASRLAPRPPSVPASVRKLQFSGESLPAHQGILSTMRTAASHLWWRFLSTAGTRGTEGTTFPVACLQSHGIQRRQQPLRSSPPSVSGGFAWRH